VCRRYEDLVAAAGLIERGRACRLLAADPPKGLGSIFVNRFGVLDEVQCALLKGLSCDAEITVAMTWDEGFAPTASVGPVIEELGKSASSWVRVEGSECKGEIERLATVLYSADQRVTATGQVRLGLAGGLEAEAELAACAADEAICRGVREERIVIAFADLGPAAHRLHTALEARGVAFETDVARSVTATALGMSFGAVLDLALGRGDRTTALTLLLGPHSDVPRNEVEALDRTWRAGRVTDSRRIASDIVGRQGSDAAGALKAVAESAKGALTPGAGRLLITAIDQLVSARARLAGATPGTALRGPGLSEDAAASRALQRAIAGMAAVDGAPFTLDDVRRTLTTVVAGGTGGEHAGYVQVTELARLRFRRFDTVIIAGLTALESPVDGTETLLDALAAMVGLEPDSDSEARARLNFYLAITRARKELVLIRKEESSEGAPMRPSVLWEEVLDAYRCADDEPDAWPAGAPEPVRLRVADVVDRAPVLHVGRREARRRAADCEGRYAPIGRGLVDDASALEAIAAQETYTVSEIEAYLQCPYRWFYERIVRPGELDSEVDDRAVGSLAHDLLKGFYECWADEGVGARVSPETLESARAVFSRISKDAGAQLLARDLADDMAIRRGIRWAGRIIEDDARVLPGFAPVAHEVIFGDEGCELELGGVRLRGRIDRVDRSEAACFVTDYKSSRKVPGQGRFAEEGRIQAVVYAEAAQRLLGGLPAAGSVYRSLRTLAMRGFWRPDVLGETPEHLNDDDAVSDQSAEALLAQTEERIANAVARIRSGDISREPISSATCKFCALAIQCEGGQA
jgi:ATP-dependent helicase/nuclease subunit B